MNNTDEIINLLKEIKELTIWRSDPMSVLITHKITKFFADNKICEDCVCDDR